MFILCLGMLLGLTYLEMAGWGGIYRPQHNSSHWRKVAALCGTPDSPAGSPRWSNGPRWRRGSSSSRRTLELAPRGDLVEEESSKACPRIGRPPRASLIGVESKRDGCGRPQIDLN
jgi:hypothetical protein